MKVAVTDLTADETRKYERVWADKKYRHQSDGEPVVYQAYRDMGCQPGETLIDWGCGAGKAATMFQLLGLWVTGFDIAANALNGEVNIRLVVGVLWDPPKDLHAEYSFCTDVLEHIPPTHVGAAMNAISARTNKAAYIQVDTVPDLSGPLMKPPEVLHLTVQPSEWWEGELRKRFGSVLAREGAFSRVGFLCGYPLKRVA